MSDINHWGREKSFVYVFPAAREFGNVADELCKKSFLDAKHQLHPLLQNMGLEALEQRREFLGAFKSALEQRVARRLAAWQPAIQAVFRFDETLMETNEAWDGSIHLLVKVSRLSEAVKWMSKTLDQSLVNSFKQFGWSRFQKRQSILDVQQVTPNELRHGIGYGAMFYAVYTVPTQIWPQGSQAK